MSLIETFLEYIQHGYTKSYERDGKPTEFFNHYISKKSFIKIEKIIMDGVVEGSPLKISKPTKTIDSKGTQYMKLKAEYPTNAYTFNLRLSTHKENKEYGDNADFHIETWLNKEKDVKEELKRFITLAIHYFNAVHKKEEGDKLHKYEKKLIDRVDKNRAFNVPKRYESLNKIHLKANKKKMDNKDLYNKVEFP